MFPSKLKIAFIFIFFSAQPRFVFSQSDTIPIRGTIKLLNQTDSTYIKAFTTFWVYKSQPVIQLHTYSDFAHSRTMYSPIQNTKRTKVIEAHPVPTSTDKTDSLPFDYSSYFEKNELTKSIKMRKGETDTVRLICVINKKGEVKFNDISPTEKKGENLIIYNQNKKEYKLDVAHSKTIKAFDQLTLNKWIPAQILALKKHPSKRKNKYNYYTAYTKGFLTIIYSNAPIK